ncbi:tRNA1Val (adenine37-N6)-methyltransferase [Cnuella takakiae]|uniref:tRNA1(Val) (adenine(37)-N6)-methyltransferase n=1 Tax=Cnuella takakiae TaxID=1302690 RepID=A0A1M4V847_9BACT|nr:methyltransferase [Cnuella takakiae]OLY92681.1 hypothetical protein BUE76_12870 [Cnuella takakiae]SHE65067.1 tRNA1Val (adenine37-N6)-methyltransferase [Cnuella takakiae]
MPNPYFQFKQFCIRHDRCAMKVTTDGCLFGAWVAHQAAGKTYDAALDIGTGTGLLSLMVAQQNQVPIDAVEIDPEAAAQAGENIAASPWPQQVNVIMGDFLKTSFSRKYPLIFSNPPFYEGELASTHQGRNLAHHAGGLLLKDLFAKTYNLLEADGQAYLLLPAKRTQEIVKLISDSGFHLAQVVRVHQTPSHAPFRLMMQLSKRAPQMQTETSLLICTEDKNYSAAFTELLKDYYLYL